MCGPRASSYILYVYVNVRVPLFCIACFAPGNYKRCKSDISYYLAVDARTIFIVLSDNPI